MFNDYVSVSRSCCSSVLELIRPDRTSPRSLLLLVPPAIKPVSMISHVASVARLSQRSSVDISISDSFFSFSRTNCILIVFIKAEEQNDNDPMMNFRVEVHFLYARKISCRVYARVGRSLMMNSEAAAKRCGETTHGNGGLWRGNYYLNERFARGENVPFPGRTYRVLLAASCNRISRYVIRQNLTLRQAQRLV